MIDCPNGGIRDQLPDYMHGQMSPAARAKVSAHVATCAACSAELALLREVHASMQVVATVDVGQIVASLPSPTGHPVAPDRAASARWRRLDWRVAASIALLAVGGGAAAILSGGRGEQVPPERIVDARVTPQEVATTAPAMDSYLSDASAVELEALLDDLESFDGLPLGEPELAVPAPDDAEEGL